jgi:tetratricopeptide (TPR) repeat protein
MMLFSAKRAALVLSSKHSTFAMICVLICALTWIGRAGAAVETASERLRNERFQKLDSDYSALQRKFEQGKITSENLRDAFRAFYPTDRDLAAKYDGWVKAYPKSYVARLARAIYYKKLGFEERGGGYISETSRAQLHNMDTALGKAIKDFGDSIPMTSKPFLSYFHMIDIGSAYAGPTYTRQLFDSAVRLDPRSADVRLKFMSALQAKWGGSLDDMQQFLEECRHANLPASQFRKLESMVYEDEGWERENDGDHAGAEAAYSKAIELDSADCTSCVVSSLVTILIADRKFDEAIPMLDRYLKAKPDNVWALNSRGLAYYGSGKPAKAVADWSRSAAAGDAFSQNRLGVLYMTGIPGSLQPDSNKGIEFLRESAAQGNTEAQHNLAVAMSQNAGQAAVVTR